MPRQVNLKSEIIIMDSSAKPSYAKITENVKILGLGKAGVKIVNRLNEIPEASWLDIAAADTDRASINPSKLENNFLIGEEWTHGLGCGGNIIKGERALAHKTNIQVKDFLTNGSLLIIVAGFGGGTATGGAPVVARLAKEKNIPVIFAVTLPFAFEGHGKRETAENQIKVLIRTSSTVIPIPNDLLYSSLPASTPFELAFKKANSEVARTVLGIAELLRCDNLISVDLCDLHNLLCKQKSECGIGIGIADREEGSARTHLALKRLMNSPLLGGRQRIKKADALIVSITGGDDLTIAEMKHTLDSITEIANKKTEIIVGANTDPLYKEKAQITVIPIRFDESAEPVEEKTQKKQSRKISKTSLINNISKLKGEAIQLELPFENRSRGIFTSTSPTMYNGEDLDIPTFQRQEIHLDKGK
jgi:cell division protein FtsZ